jgi:hypothetical protein
MPAHAGIHDFLCCNDGTSWIPPGTCPRAARWADPGAGMTGGSTEESIIRAPGIIRERLRQRPVFQVQEHACSALESIACEQLHRIGAVRCPLGG